jgi:hypothetical protein
VGVCNKGLWEVRYSERERERGTRWDVRCEMRDARRGGSVRWGEV